VRAWLEQRYAMTAREVILDVTIAGALIFSLLSRRIISG
jgi:hypothetical protein